MELSTLKAALKEALKILIEGNEDDGTLGGGAGLTSKVEESGLCTSKESGAGVCTSSKESGAGVCTLEDSGAGACTSKERGDGVCTSSKESGAGACTSKERGDGVCTSSKESGAGVCTSKERGNGVCTSKESGVGACTSKERGAGVCSNLTSDICKELLCGSPITEEKDDDSKESAISLDFLTGYPRSPLYERLAQSMYYWIVTGKCPVFELPVMYMLNEDATIDTRKRKLEIVGESLLGIKYSWEKWSGDEKTQRMLQVLKVLDLRGILDLLGLRCTLGSCIPSLPPSREVLLASFNKQHCPTAKLSVGGRALTKHCHRDLYHQMWGKCTGTETDKNKHALEVVTRLLNRAVWINIHTLPHNVQVIEVRSEEGYGVRWLSDGSEFRGFLEPQMKDGHEVHWRH